MTARRQRLATWSAVAGALALYAVMAVSGSAGKSNAFDEIAHLTAGYTYWTAGGYRLQPENGNWPQRLGALPAVLGGATPASRTSLSWAQSDVWTVGDEFFFARGNDIDRFLFQGRALIAGLGVLLGALVFLIARKVTGSQGAWLALGLFVFSPTMLAHGALVTSDMAAALGFVASVSAIWVVLHRMSPLTIVASALAVSALLLSKFSGVLIAPIALLLVGLRLFLRRPLIWRIRARDQWRIERAPGRQLGLVSVAAVAHVFVAVSLIWASYGFRYSAFADSGSAARFFVDWPQVLRAGLQGDSPIVSVVEWARDARVLPEAYLYGFSHTMTFAQARPSFLNGVVATTGRASFFPLAFLMKSTIPFLAFLAAGLAAWWKFSLPRRRYAAIPLGVLVVVYGAAALTSNLNIGHRHLLPIYPALMVLAGASVWWIRAYVTRERWRRGFTAAVLLLLAWHIVESVRVRPHYLTYFNELAGGPAGGYRHLVDSSLDWGQDLPSIKKWLDANRRDGETAYLSYFGTSRPSHFGIDAVMLPGFLDRRPPERGERLSPGLYIFSATMLSGVYTRSQGRWDEADETQYQQLLGAAAEFFSRPNPPADQAAGILEALDQFRFSRLSEYLRRRQPTAEIANSVLVFRLSESELHDALAGPLTAKRVE